MPKQFSDIPGLKTEELAFLLRVHCRFLSSQAQLDSQVLTRELIRLFQSGITGETLLISEFEELVDQTIGRAMDK